MSASEVPVRAVGVVCEILSETVCRVELPNGKISLGHLSRTLRNSDFELVAGSKVQLELTPFDFSKGRITGPAETFQ